jgi:very-short-patch-repair endonuclease
MSRHRRSDSLSACDPERIEFARDQRKQSNEFANSVWQMLRGWRMRGQKFRREHPIPPYTVDFVCLGLKLIVEVDGKNHYTKDGVLADDRRDRFLRGEGFEVLRISGYQVTQQSLDVRGLIEDAIDRRLQLFFPSPPAPSPQSTGERGARVSGGLV